MKGLISKIHNYKHKKYLELRRLALSEAQRIAYELGRKFGAKEVILYGSLSKRDKIFDGASDIDLAVRGLGRNYLRAYGHCLQLGRFTLDIKAYEDLPQEVRAKIKRKGLLLYAQK